MTRPEGTRLASGVFALTREAETARLGRVLGAALRRGEAICLDGPLGAGKSVLARGLIRGFLPNEADIPSPTFTLVQTYPNPRLLIAHFDLYRLKSPEEAYELGLDDALRDGAAVIEWAERLEGDLPPDRLEILIQPAESGDNARFATLRPFGAWKDRRIEF